MSSQNHPKYTDLKTQNLFFLLILLKHEKTLNSFIGFPSYFPRSQPFIIFSFPFQRKVLSIVYNSTPANIIQERAQIPRLSWLPSLLPLGPSIMLKKPLGLCTERYVTRPAQLR